MSFTTSSDTTVGTTSTKLYMPSKMMACEPVTSPLATPNNPRQTVRAIENLSVPCSVEGIRRELAAHAPPIRVRESLLQAGILRGRASGHREPDLDRLVCLRHHGDHDVGRACRAPQSARLAIFRRHTHIEIGCCAFRRLPGLLEPFRHGPRLGNRRRGRITTLQQNGSRNGDTCERPEVDHSRYSASPGNSRNPGTSLAVVSHRRTRPLTSRAQIRRDFSLA